MFSGNIEKTGNTRTGKYPTGYCYQQIVGSADLYSPEVQTGSSRNW